MSDAKVAHRVAGVGRLGTAAAWISAVCCLPYLILKVVWTLDIPLGITDRSVLDDAGWVAANAVMAVIQLVGLLVVVALTRAWSRRVPAWLLLVPVWVGTGLLFQVTVGAVLAGLFSPPSSGSGETDFGEFAPWVYVTVYTSFAGQGAALAIAFACHVRDRWGPMLGERTAEMVAGRSGRRSSWPQRHLGVIAEVVAGTAIALAVILGYWAAGGSFGLPSGRQEIWPMQASRLTGAVLAAVGLLAVAGRWGPERRFWLPATLIWLGSGALVAFDGLNLVLNHLSFFFGTDASGWSLFDTVLTLKVGIGLVAAAAGVLAIAAAGKDGRLDPGLPDRVDVQQAA